MSFHPPALHVHNVQRVLEKPTLELIVLLTAGSEGWRRINLEKPAV